MYLQTQIISLCYEEENTPFSACMELAIRNESRDYLSWEKLRSFRLAGASPTEWWVIMPRYRVNKQSLAAERSSWIHSEDPLHF